MELRRGTPDDAEAVVSLWNAIAQDHNSAWQYSPTKSAADIEGLLNDGFSLVVAYDADSLLGFGLWYGERITGVAASNQEAFYKITRAWAEQNPGNVGVVIVPGSPSYEREWLDALNVWDFQPMGYKPLAPGDDPATRKIWTYRGKVNLDALKAAIDDQLGG